jgi:23S rRNA (adenine2503-C2)-methyltransferase
VTLTNVRSLSLDEIVAWSERRGFPRFRASQVAGWLYNRPLAAVRAMHNLPSELRAALEEDFDCLPPEVARASRSQDGTVKLLVRLADGRVVESVLIPRDERITLCLSSQVGCALGCAFCATAQLGLLRNLEAGEIISQVLLARAEAGPHVLTNYVFMGMGEPLANYDRLVRAIGIMTARWGLGISPRRITVSTVGLIPQIERLVAETAVHIAVSLTGATNAVRDRVMPINKRYPVEELVAACARLDLPRRKRITFEYVMLAGVNDRTSDADDLIALCRMLRVKVNLIPLNPFPGSAFQRPEDDVVLSFQNRLLAAGIQANVRVSRGRDIEAACGQLAATG